MKNFTISPTGEPYCSTFRILAIDFGHFPRLITIFGVIFGIGLEMESSPFMHTCHTIYFPLMY